MEHNLLISDGQRLTRGPGEHPEPVMELAFAIAGGLPGTGKPCFCSQLAEGSLLITKPQLRGELTPCSSDSPSKGVRY